MSTNKAEEEEPNLMHIFPKWWLVAIFLDVTFFQGRRSHLKQRNRYK